MRLFFQYRLLSCVVILPEARVGKWLILKNPVLKEHFDRDWKIAACNVERRVVHGVPNTTSHIVLSVGGIPITRL